MAAPKRHSPGAAGKTALDVFSPIEHLFYPKANPSTPAELQKRVRSEIIKWTKAAKARA